MSTFLSYTKANRAVLELYLDGNDLSSSGADVLAQGVQQAASLSGLSLRGNKIGERGNLALAGALQLNRRMRAIDVAETDLTIAALIAYTTVLRSGSSLAALDLSRPLLKSTQVWVESEAKGKAKG